MSNLKLAVQLYTVRDDLQRDFEGTLSEIHGMGVRYVELAGLSGRTAEEVGHVMASIGLTPIAGHYSLDELEQGLDSVLHQARHLGFHWIVLPWIAQADYRDGWPIFGMRLESIARKVASAGYGFAYHNHAFELELENGRPGLEVLFESTDPAVVRAELDTYWLKVGGYDPLTFIRRLSGRLPLIHFKDVGADGRNAACGSGTLPWDPILLACDESAVEFAIIELDEPVTTALADVRTSVEFLRSAGIAG